MSDMSFKQAKEIVDRIELAELTLNRTLEHIDESSKEFNKSLDMQKKIVEYFPKVNLKINVLRVLVGINIGFIAGLLVGKFFL